MARVQDSYDVTLDIAASCRGTRRASCLTLATLWGSHTRGGLPRHTACSSTRIVPWRPAWLHHMPRKAQKLSATGE
eukprot:scaffold49067_cov25-Tisochrysis_lutea.AAC.1